MDRARAELTAAVGASSDRVPRLSLKVVKRELRQVTRILEEGLRSGGVAADVGLRLLDLGRGTRALLRNPS